MWYSDIDVYYFLLVSSFVNTTMRISIIDDIIVLSINYNCTKNIWELDNKNLTKGPSQTIVWKYYEFQYILRDMLLITHWVITKCL